MLDVTSNTNMMGWKSPGDVVLRCETAWRAQRYPHLAF
jgi:hypothetical protein